MDAQLLLASLLILLLLEFPTVAFVPSAAGFPFVFVPAVAVVPVDPGIPSDSSIPSLVGVRNGIPTFFLSLRMVRTELRTISVSVPRWNSDRKHQNFHVPRCNFCLGKWQPTLARLRNLRICDSGVSPRICEFADLKKDLRAHLWL